MTSRGRSSQALKPRLARRMPHSFIDQGKLSLMAGGRLVLLCQRGKAIGNKRSALEEDLLRTDSIFYSF